MKVIQCNTQMICALPAVCSTNQQRAAWRVDEADKDIGMLEHVLIIVKRCLSLEYASLLTYLSTESEVGDIRPFASTTLRRPQGLSRPLCVRVQFAIVSV